MANKPDETNNTGGAQPQPRQACSADQCSCYPHAGQAAVPPAGHGVAPRAAINMAELWKLRVDKYWQQEFRKKSLAYRPAMLIQVPHNLDYDPDTLTIEYDPAVLNAIIATTGNFGLVIALAHEVGHHVQMLRGRYDHFIPAIQREFDADRLAGSYLGWAQRHGFLDNCDFGVAAMAVFRAGDTLPVFNPQAHGTPAQRVHNFLQGYLRGPDPF
ncbi:MAG TPA: hypothetical protein VJX71_28775 [Methylomirabilota bacterium]|nr:hypothetical protein [Methylomirabilota bacterium]